MNIEVINSLEKLDAIKEQWNAVLNDMKGRDIFLTPEWCAAWWKIFGKNKTLNILTISENELLVGIVPLYSYKKGLFKYLTFVGLPNHSDRVDFIIREKYAAECIKVFFDFISSENNWDVLILGRVAALANTEATLDNVIKSNNMRFIKRKDAVYPYLNLEKYNDYDDFVEIYFKAKHRGNLKRERSKIDNILKAEWKISSHIDDQLIHEMIEIDSIRSKRGKNEQSFLKCIENSKFIKQIGNEMANNEYAKIIYVLINGHIAAYSLIFDYNNKILNYQMAYDETYSKEAVGTHIILQSIKYALNNEKNEYDLLMGDENYKSRWTDGIRQSLCYYVYGNTIFGTIIQYYEKYIKQTMNNVGRYIINNIYLVLKKSFITR